MPLKNVITTYRKLPEERGLETMMPSLLMFMPSTSCKRNSILIPQTKVPSTNTHLMRKAIMVSGLTVILVLTSDASIGISIRGICAGEDSLDICTSVNTRISRP